MERIFFISFLVAILVMPRLIALGKSIGMYALGGENRQEPRKIPVLGGIGIFLAFSTTLIIHALIVGNSEVILFLCSTCIIVFGGYLDDRYDMSPYKKLAFQGVAIGMLMIGYDLYIPLFGTTVIAISLNYGITFVGALFLINAFNLIDGVDGLAGTIGTVILGALSTYLYCEGQLFFATIGIATMGAILGFLVFNFAPAKVFMGDAGSLTCGLIITFLALKAWNTTPLQSQEWILSGPLFVVLTLTLILTDTIRVIIIRLSNGVSPLKGDKNHLHHRCQELGLNRSQTVLAMAGANLIFIVTELLLSEIVYAPIYGLLLLAGAMLLMVMLLFIVKKPIMAKRTLSFVFVGIIINSCAQNLYDPKGYTGKEEGTTYESYQYEHRLMAGDQLSLSVWDHPDLSIGSVFVAIGKDPEQGKWVTIDQNGNALLPMIGEIHIGGMSLKEAEEFLENSYSEYVTSPQITLKVINLEVTISGEVEKPGVYSIERQSIPLTKLIGLSGGITHYAKTSSVQILRGNPAIPDLTIADMRYLKNMGASDIQIYPEDVVYIPSRRAKRFDNASQKAVPFVGIVSALAIFLSTVR